MYPSVGTKIRRVGLGVNFCVNDLDKRDELSLVCNSLVVEGTIKFNNKLKGEVNKFWII